MLDQPCTQGAHVIYTGVISIDGTICLNNEQFIRMLYWQMSCFISNSPVSYNAVPSVSEPCPLPPGVCFLMQANWWETQFQKPPVTIATTSLLQRNPASPPMVPGGWGVGINPWLPGDRGNQVFNITPVLNVFHTIPVPFMAGSCSIMVTGIMFRS